MTARIRVGTTAGPGRAADPGRPFNWLLAGFGGALVVLALALGQGVLSYREIFSDPADTYAYNPMAGLVSNVGLLLWAAAAGIALMAQEVLRRRGDRGWHGRFLLVAGLFTVFLMVDDAFLLHELVLPDMLGIRERYVKAAYLGAAFMFGVTFFRYLVRGDGLVLLLASGFFFATSLLFDNPASVAVLGLTDVNFVLYVVEDGSKFVGITLWLCYVSRTAIGAVAARG